mmetsp:Transcript_40128/g.133821  ORF Transcript_40128/g.133821 Transcript_40128/m.133821 type:complete len:252 (-) Transcript_40128:1865-2620(-)
MLRRFRVAVRVPAATGVALAPRAAAIVAAAIAAALVAAALVAAHSSGQNVAALSSAAPGEMSEQSVRRRAARHHPRRLAARLPALAALDAPRHVVLDSHVEEGELELVEPEQQPRHTADAAEPRPPADARARDSRLLLLVLRLAAAAAIVRAGRTPGGGGASRGRTAAPDARGAPLGGRLLAPCACRPAVGAGRNAWVRCRRLASLRLGFGFRLAWSASLRWSASRLTVPLEPTGEAARLTGEASRACQRG